MNDMLAVGDAIFTGLRGVVSLYLSHWLLTGVIALMLFRRACNVIDKLLP